MEIAAEILRYKLDSKAGLQKTNCKNAKSGVQLARENPRGRRANAPTDLTQLTGIPLDLREQNLLRLNFGLSYFYMLSLRFPKNWP